MFHLDTNTWLTVVTDWRCMTVGVGIRWESGAALIFFHISTNFFSFAAKDTVVGTRNLLEGTLGVYRLHEKINTLAAILLDVALFSGTQHNLQIFSLFPSWFQFVFVASKQMWCSPEDCCSFACRHVNNKKTKITLFSRETTDKQFLQVIGERKVSGQIEQLRAHTSRLIQHATS